MACPSLVAAGPVGLEAHCFFYRAKCVAQTSCALFAIKLKDAVLTLMVGTIMLRQECGSIPGPEVIKLFSYSIQLSMKFFLLINVKMPTIVGISTFINMKYSSLGLSEPKKAEFLDIFILMSI